MPIITALTFLAFHFEQTVAQSRRRHRHRRRRLFQVNASQWPWHRALAHFNQSVKLLDIFALSLSTKFENDCSNRRPLTARCLFIRCTESLLSIRLDSNRWRNFWFLRLNIIINLMKFHLIRLISFWEFPFESRIKLHCPLKWFKTVRHKTWFGTVDSFHSFVLRAEMTTKLI